MSMQDAPSTQDAQDTGGRGTWLRAGITVAVLVLAFVLVRISGFDQYLSISALSENRQWLLDEVARLGLGAALIFIAVYAVAVAFSVPGAVVLTVTSGFLFGPVFGTLYAVVGATLGAIGLFLFVKLGLGGSLQSRAGGTIDRLRRGFSDNALGYLLFLRLLPIFPFWLVNLAAAVLGVSLGIFTIATFVGIIPGAAVFASFGSGIGSLLDAGKPVDLASVLTPAVILPLVALALLSLAPMVYKRYRAARTG